MGRPLRYRELLRKLRVFGVDEKDSPSGGSKRMLYKENVEGRKRSYPIDTHSEHHEFGLPIINPILRHFKIHPDEFWKV